MKSINSNCSKLRISFFIVISFISYSSTSALATVADESQDFPATSIATPAPATSVPVTMATTAAPDPDSVPLDQVINLGLTGLPKENLTLYKALRDSIKSYLISLKKKRSHFDDAEYRKPAGVANFLKKLRTSDDMEAVLRTVECLPGNYLFAAGSKAEQEFPNQKSIEIAQAFYQRALTCDKGEPAVKAGYRLGLLYVWQKRYAEANETLAKITDLQDAVDYRSRIYYWRSQCAEKLQNIALKKEMTERLLTEFPLSFHATLAGSGVGSRVGSITNSDKTSQPTLNLSPADQILNSNREPLVIFRSKKVPTINQVISIAEILIQHKKRNLAALVLSKNLETIKTAEPGLQLYVSVLFMRAGNFLDRTKLLAQLLRDNPNLISKSSMLMLYPMEKMNILQTMRTDLDRRLVISLIRQESAFNERARSSVGALGLMQLMPKTARTLERVSKHQLFHPVTNIRIGVKYLARLIVRFKGDTELALAAYNAGPQRVSEWSQRYAVGNKLLFMDMIPYKETREYVASIIRNYYWYDKLYPNRGERNSNYRFKLAEYVASQASNQEIQTRE